MFKGKASGYPEALFYYEGGNMLNFKCRKCRSALIAIRIFVNNSKLTDAQKLALIAEEIENCL